MENIFRIELNISGIIISCVAIWLFCHQIKKRTKEHKVFLMLAYFTMVELLLDSMFWLVDSRMFVSAREINMAVNTLYYLFQILQCYVWMRYCQIHLDWKSSNIKTGILVTPLVIGVVILVINPWTGFVFSVDDANVYARAWGLWGSIEAACCMIYPLYCIVLATIKICIGDKRKDAAYLLLVSIIPILSTVIQMLVYGLNFIWIGNALALLLLLIEIEVKQYQNLQQQLTEKKIQIMLSQIQPHFLYNTLTTIANLCDENPQKAKIATVSFSRYLRVNLDSLKQKELVPFERELKHIEIYLSLEKMRFEDELIILYDIKTIDFLIPSLTIQPLVENAVKYGVGQKAEGGTVKLSTYEYEGFYIIEVSDNGVGFDPSEVQHDGRSHIGIENVKNRLHQMCGGEMEIESHKGQGTSVTVKIPKE